MPRDPPFRAIAYPWADKTTSCFGLTCLFKDEIYANFLPTNIINNKNEGLIQLVTNVKN